MSAAERIVWPRMRDLPDIDRAMFEHWLFGQTRPWIEGAPEDQQDGYFPWDYEKYQEGSPCELG